MDYAGSGIPRKERKIVLQRLYCCISNGLPKLRHIKFPKDKCKNHYRNVKNDQIDIFLPMMHNHIDELKFFLWIIIKPLRKGGAFEMTENVRRDLDGFENYYGIPVIDYVEKLMEKNGRSHSRSTEKIRRAYKEINGNIFLKQLPKLTGVIFTDEDEGGGMASFFKMDHRSGGLRIFIPRNAKDKMALVICLMKKDIYRYIHSKLSQEMIIRIENNLQLLWYR